MPHQSILIVEDEPDLRETLKDLLELSGFNVVTAANGEEGLAQLSEMDGACLILLDLMMPVMDGWQFLDEIRRYPNHRIATTPIVVISAAADLGVLDARRVRRVLEKPVDIKQLVVLAQESCSAM